MTMRNRRKRIGCGDSTATAMGTTATPAGTSTVVMTATSGTTTQQTSMALTVQ